MNPSREGWLRRDGVDLHYVEWDGDGSPILLLHGLSSNARYWDRIADHMRNRRLVALDQRGHGLTGSASGRGFAMRDLLLDVGFLATELGLRRPVVAGHSWGAGVALEFVAKSPEHASGLVFIDGPLMGVARIFDWHDMQAMMQPPLPHYATLADAVAESKRDFGTAWGDDLLPFVETRMVRDGGGWIQSMSTAARLEILRGIYDSDPEKLWPDLQVPAVVLVARKSEARISRATEEGIARLRKIAPSVPVERFQTPHDIPLYAPAEVAAEIESLAAQNDLRLSHLRDELSTGVTD